MIRNGVDLQSYTFVLAFVVFSVVLAVLLYLLSYLVVPKFADQEKLSAYECGFDPFSDTRGFFDVRFYLVSILFIIFDLEIVFIFPWASSAGYMDFSSYLLVMSFLFILTVGFVYEWSKGALEWE